MAKPTALTELNGAKMLGLIDSATTTSLMRQPASLVAGNQTTGGDTTIPPGWMAVGSHSDGLALLSPAGWVIPSPSPLMLMGGADSASTTEGSRLARPLRVHEGGSQYVLPGSSLAPATNAYQAPLKAVGGSFLTTAGGANNQTLTNTLASNFGYMTDITIIVDVVLTGAATVLILDASGGTTMHEWQFPATAWPVKHTQFPFHFTVPIRTAAAGAAFFVTTTGSAGSWQITCNGFFATA